MSTPSRKPEDGQSPQNQFVLTPSKFVTQILVPSLVATLLLQLSGLQVQTMNVSQLSSGLAAAIWTTLFILLVEHKGKKFIQKYMAGANSKIGYLLSLSAVNAAITALSLLLFFQSW